MGADPDKSGVDPPHKTGVGAGDDPPQKRGIGAGDDPPHKTGVGAGDAVGDDLWVVGLVCWG